MQTLFQYSGAFALWLGAFNRIKEFVKPSGHDIIQQIKDGVAPLDAVSAAGNIPEILRLGRNMVKLFETLIPHISEHNIADAAFNFGHGLQTIADRIEGGGKQPEIAKMLKDTAWKLLSALK